MRWICSFFLIACTGETVLDKQQNAAPTILIASHGDLAEVQEGVAESFRATVSDDDDQFEDLSVAWYLDEEVVCDWSEASLAGESVCDIVLEMEDSTIVAEVRDPQGSGGRAEIAIVVLPTEAPVVEILSPTIAGGYYSDQLIEFSALVSDLEDDSADLQIRWSSSLDGDLDLNTEVDSSGEISDYAYLSEGQHALDLRVEDSTGKVTTESVVFDVRGNNNIPSCEITEPTDGSASQQGGTVMFRGTATDPDIPNNELAIEWSSSIDGALSTASATTSGELSVAYSGLSVGTHTITLAVQDEVGALCSDAIFYTVGTPPTIVLDSPLDDEVYSVGESISFQATVSDAQEAASALSLSWVSSIDNEFSTQTALSNGVAQFVYSALSAGEHTISVTVTDSAGLQAQEISTIRINTPPTAPVVSISPVPANTNATLVATASGSVDADGDTVSYSYEWYQNGVVTANLSTTVPSTDTGLGDIWTVRVTPDDGVVDGAYTEASIEIVNTAPVFTSAAGISPSTGVYTGTVLTCSAAATDPDDGVLTPTYEWTVGGTVLATGTSYTVAAADTTVGDTIVCTATATDQDNESTSSAASVVLSNTDPVSDAISIVQSSIQTNSAVECQASWTEADGESVTTTYTWSNGTLGTTLGTGSSLQLDPTMVQPTQLVTCTATGQDSSGGTASASVSLAVDNTAPSISQVSISPAIPYNDSTLGCTVSASDADGEVLTESLTWHNDTLGTVLGTGSSVVLSSSLASAADTIRCAVTTSDSYGGSDSASAVVTLGNRPPDLPLVTLTPAPAYVDSTLTCSASSPTDPDGDSVQIGYSWFVNGGSISNATDTFSSGFSVGDAVVCTVSFSDGSLSTSASASVTVENQAPVITSVTLLPDPAQGDDMLTVSATATDVEGDSLLFDYIWSVAGTSVQSGATNTLDSSYFVRGDTVSVSVRAYDQNAYSVPSVASLVISNAPPNAPTISLSPSAPIELQDDLTCSVDAISTDVDGDSSTYTFTWTIVGLGAYSAAIDSPLSSTVPASDTSSGEEWQCTVTPNDGIEDGTAASVSVLIGSEWDGQRDFGTCSNTGRYGPSQSQCDSAYSGSTLDGNVTVSSGIQLWTVPQTGTYRITAVGAQGGDGGANGPVVGGLGAQMEGDFSLIAGDVLAILVGQEGESRTGGYVGGGGGGSFVWMNSTNTLLIAAGGGGGSGGQAGSVQSCHYGMDAVTSQNGTHSNSVSTGAGTNGGGGVDISGQNAGGGAGWLSNGTGGDACTPYATGGSTPLSGGVGGQYGGNSGTVGSGGFGGGGGGQGSCNATGGGGGGGYSGGGPGSYSNGSCSFSGGGGGGSYNSGANPNNVGGANSDQGYVAIDRL